MRYSNGDERCADPRSRVHVWWPRVFQYFIQPFVTALFVLLDFPSVIIHFMFLLHSFSRGTHVLVMHAIVIHYAKYLHRLNAIVTHGTTIRYIMELLVRVFSLSLMLPPRFLTISSVLNTLILSLSLGVSCTTRHNYLLLLLRLHFFFLL